MTLGLSDSTSWELDLVAIYVSFLFIPLTQAFLFLTVTGLFFLRQAEDFLRSFAFAVPFHPSLPFNQITLLYKNCWPDGGDFLL